jgi:acyl-CoA synthetase (NDP forming)
MIASAGAEHYRRSIEIVLTADEVDSLIVIFTPVDPRTADEIIQAIRDGVSRARRAGATDKPVLACVMAEPGRPVPVEVGGERLPAYAFPENAARTLAKVMVYAEWRLKKPGLLWGFDDVRVEDARAVCREALSSRGECWLADAEVRHVLAAFGLPVIPGVLAHGADEAVARATEMGFPVVAKLSSTRVQHKTDIGGVRLNLTDSAAVRRAFNDLRALTRDDPILIQPMISGGVETMMGITTDPLFGALVGFGLGGIHVEILGDVRFRIAPLTDRDVDEQLHEIRGFRLLEGYRGHPAADLNSLREMLLRLSRLADTVPEISELDLNPVIALAPGKGCWIVDARVRVRPALRAAPPDTPPPRAGGR